MVYVTNNSEKSSTKTTLGTAEDEDEVGKEEAAADSERTSEDFPKEEILAPVACLK